MTEILTLNEEREMPAEDLATEIAAAVEETDITKIGEVIPDGQIDEGAGETPAGVGDGTEEVSGGTGEEVDDGTGETSGETEVVEEETPSELSPEVLERAVSVGIPVADARGVTPDSLERIIKGREEAFEQEAMRERLVKEKEKEEVKEEIVDPFADLPKLDPDVHDAATIAMFDQLTAIAKQQSETIQGFHAKQEESQRASEAVNQRDTERWFDERVAGLGEDFTESLGAGGYSSLTPGSPQLIKRDELAETVTVLLAGYNAQERQAPPAEEVFARAARLVLEKEYQQIREKKLAKDLGGQAGQHIQRAGGRRAKSTQTIDDETAALIDEKFGK